MAPQGCGALGHTAAGLQLLRRVEDAAAKLQSQGGCGERVLVLYTMCLCAPITPCSLCIMDTTLSVRLCVSSVSLSVHPSMLSPPPPSLAAR